MCASIVAVPDWIAQRSNEYDRDREVAERKPICPIKHEGRRRRRRADAVSHRAKPLRHVLRDRAARGEVFSDYAHSDVELSWNGDRGRATENETDDEEDGPVSYAGEDLGFRFRGIVQNEARGLQSLLSALKTAARLSSPTCQVPGGSPTNILKSRMKCA